MHRDPEQIPDENGKSAAMADGPQAPSAAPSSAPMADPVALALVEEPRRVLREIRLLNRERDTSESELENRERVEGDRLRNEHNRARADLESRYDQAIRSERLKHEQQSTHILDRANQEIEALEDEFRSLKQRLDEQQEDQVDRIRKSWQEARWLTDSVFEAAEPQPQAWLDKLQNEVRLLRDRLATASQQSVNLLDRYRQRIPEVDFQASVRLPAGPARGEEGDVGANHAAADAAAEDGGSEHDRTSAVSNVPGAPPSSSSDVASATGGAGATPTPSPTPAWARGRLEAAYLAAAALVQTRTAEASGIDASKSGLERCVEEAEAEVARLAQLRVPRLFAGAAIGFIAIIIFAAAVAAAGAASGWTSIPAYLTGAVIGLLLAIGAVIGLHRIARRQAVAMHLQVVACAAAGAAVAGQVERQAVAKRNRWRARIIAERDRDLESAKRKHESMLRALEERVREERARITQDFPARIERRRQERDERLRHLGAEHAAAAADLIAGRARDLEALDAGHEDALSVLHDEVSVAWASLTTRWSECWQHVRSMRTDAETVRRAGFPSWSETFWSNWTPPAAFVTAVPFGELHFELGQVEGGIPRHPRLLEDADAFQFALPAAVRFPEQASILIDASLRGRAQAVAAVQNYMMRLLTSMPPGKIRFLLIDPVSLGRNFAGFMHLADHDDALVGGRIWTESRHIEQRLLDLTEHMEHVIQKYLRNEFASITEYNERAGAVAEPYRILVICDFPVNFNEVSARRLASLAASGPRCGVHTIIIRDVRQSLPAGCTLEDLCAHSQYLRERSRTHETVGFPGRAAGAFVAPGGSGPGGGRDRTATSSTTGTAPGAGGRTSSGGFWARGSGGRTFSRLGPMDSAAPRGTEVARSHDASLFDADVLAEGATKVDAAPVEPPSGGTTGTAPEAPATQTASIAADDVALFGAAISLRPAAATSRGNLDAEASTSIDLQAASPVSALSAAASDDGEHGRATTDFRRTAGPGSSDQMVDGRADTDADAIEPGAAVEFIWRDPDFSALRLTFEAPPPESLAIQLLHRIGEASRDATRVEVAFDVIAPDPDRGEVWSRTCDRELSVPLGRAGATRLQSLSLGRGTNQHVLIAGKTGSGKSTLLHVLITNLALWYPPDEVHFYLVDFKKGVEFKTYATHELPHARAIAVESDREFGVSVLQRVDAELKRRGELFRELGAQDLGAYRTRRRDDQPRLPRTLLIIDEFQEFFTEDDRIGQEAALLLDRLVRQGRAFGIHVILGSQTLSGAYTLARSTMGQMGVRIALQCSETDSYLIFNEDNSAARLLNRPGEAIYNDAAGNVEGNSPFQICWLPESERGRRLDALRALADTEAGRAVQTATLTATATAGSEADSRVVFEGNVLPQPTANRSLAALVAEPAWEDARRHAAPAIWLGEPVAIRPPIEVRFERRGGSHLMIIGQQEETAENMLLLALAAIAAQVPPVPRPASGGDRDEPGFLPPLTVLDGSEAGSSRGEEDLGLAGFGRLLPHGAEPVPWTQIGPRLAALERLVNERTNAEISRVPGERSHDRERDPHVPMFLIINGLHRFRMVRAQEDDFGFSFGSGAGGPGPGTGEAEAPARRPDQAFDTILRDGPAAGVHVIFWCDSVANLNRTIKRNSLREIEQRVLFQMSESDSSALIESPDAARLGLKRAISYREEFGHVERFRPYTAPPAAWLRQVAAQLHARATHAPR